MSATAPTRIWWSAAEIAAEALPDMPATTRGVNTLSERLNWRSDPHHAQRRKGRGGGWEYHWKLFPMATQKKLLAEVAVKAGPNVLQLAAAERNDTWAWFDALPDSVKDKTQERLKRIQMVEALVTSGLTKFLAVAEVARMTGIADKTLWNWFGLIESAAEADRLPYLAPRNRLAIRNDKKADCSPEFMERLKGDFLRLERPSFASCYRRIKRLCLAEGLQVLPDRTARRRLNELVPRVTQIFAREGYIGLARCFPPQTRDRTGMVALEGVNADCHKFDVFVLWPGEVKPARAQIVAFQDLYSGKILSWRIDHSPNKVAVMAAFGDLIEEYGIPQRCLFDNGREFANKWLTGGAKTRFRFKIRDDDPLGVLTLLGIKIHWATPAHGQAKPIERAFRDFADDIAKDPRFAGAYVGHKTDAKPENYNSHAVPIDDFITVVAEGVIEHNARLGRLSDTANGRSFDQTFAESYATAAIRKATEEQRRLWLMGQEVLTLHKTHGRLTMHRNKYWSDWMNEFAGQKVVARFDPEDLHAGIHIYALDGAFMGFAACEEKSEFFNLTSAKDTARRKASIRRAEKRLLEQHRTIPISQIAADMNGIAQTPTAAIEAKVVQPVFGKKTADKPLMTRPVHKDCTTSEDAAQQAAFVASFNDEKSKRVEALEAIEEPLERFKRALEIEQRSAAGQPVGEAETRWLTGYQTTGEYRGQRRMYENFGDTMFLN